MFNTEACLNGSFLALPDAHFRTTTTNPGIDLDQVIAVFEKLRSCDPTIEKLVCFDVSSNYFVVVFSFSYLNIFNLFLYHYLKQLHVLKHYVFILFYHFVIYLKMKTCLKQSSHHMRK